MGVNLKLPSTKLKYIKCNCITHLFKLDLVCFIVLLVSLWTSIVYLCFNHITTSKYYNLENNYEIYKQKSKHLEQSSFSARSELKEWLNATGLSLDSSKYYYFSEANRPRNYMCVGILSKNRISTNSNYVNQAVMAFLTRTPATYRNDIFFVGFNMEDNPDDNKNLLDLSELIFIKNLSSGIKDANLRVKEAADYALALSYFREKNCNYSILMEDDAIISYDWYVRVKSSLDYIESTKTKFIYMKLFTGFKFFDWDWVKFPFQILKLSLNSMLLCFLTFSLHTLLVNSMTDNLVLYKSIKQTPTSIFRQAKRLIRLKIVAFVLILFNSFGVMILFKATSTTPCGDGARVYSTGFGTVSVLYPISNLMLISSYLNKTVYDYTSGKSTFFEAKDLLIDRVKVGYNLTEYIIEPSIVQHIGMHSSVYNRDLSNTGYSRMYKSFSYPDSHKLIEFDQDYLNLNNF